jgi:anti-anti-sigma regulatory factor
MAERVLGPGEEFHRLIWHDRKAWWQQEQGILAYLILAGSLKNADYMRLARESAAFYNAWFPDHDSGGVYFNVLATGIPYLLGTERLKGSHSMSGYHSFELCYLAAIYTNLLLTKQPMDFYFKPQPGALQDNILRVQPDILPPGSVRIEAVWVNGERYANFDAQAMTITLPAQHATAPAPHPLQQRPAWAGNPTLLPATTREELRIKVRIAPAGLTYDMELTMQDGVAELLLEGIFDDHAEVALMGQLGKVVAAQPKRVVLYMADVHTLSKACARALAFIGKKLDLNTDITVIQPNQDVKDTLRSVGFLEQVTVVDDTPQVATA